MQAKQEIPAHVDLASIVMPRVARSMDLLPLLLPHVISASREDVWVAMLSGQRCSAIASLHGAVSLRSGFTQSLAVHGLQHPLLRSLAIEAWRSGAERLAFGRTDGPGLDTRLKRDQDYERTCYEATKMMGLRFENYWVLSRVDAAAVRVLYTSRRRHDDADANPYLLSLQAG